MKTQIREKSKKNDHFDTINLLVDKLGITFMKFFPVVLALVGIISTILLFLGGVSGFNEHQIEGILLLPVVIAVFCLLGYFVLYFLVIGILLLVKSLKKFDISMLFLGLFTLCILIFFILIALHNAQIIDNKTPLMQILLTNYYIFDLANLVLKISSIGLILFIASTFSKIFIDARK